MKCPYCNNNTISLKNRLLKKNIICPYCKNVSNLSSLKKFLSMTPFIVFGTLFNLFTSNTLIKILLFLGSFLISLLLILNVKPEKTIK